jgi:uncharacterized protein YndB with AHSA1/START domain
VILASCDRLIAAPIDLVWSLISTSEGLTEWMAVEATLDLRVGGRIRWVHDNGWVVAGTVREVTPMRRLAYTYGWEHGGFPVALESSVVTIELTARGGVTELAIRHEGLTPEMADHHAAGWALFVGRLADRAELLVPVRRPTGGRSQ